MDRPGRTHRPLTPGVVKLVRALFLGASGLMACLGLFFIVMGGLEWWRAADSVNWPHVTGTVRSSEVARSSHVSLGRGVRHTSHQASVEYGYQVDGVEYTGTRVAFTVSGGAAAEAKAQADAFPPGYTTEVYYHPSDPSVCVLQPGWDWRNVIPVAAGTFAVAFCALFAFLTLRMTRVMMKVAR